MKTQELIDKQKRDRMEQFPMERSRGIASFILRNANNALALQKILSVMQEVNDPNLLENAKVSVKCLEDAIRKDFHSIFGHKLAPLDGDNDA